MELFKRRLRKESTLSQDIILPEVRSFPVQQIARQLEELALTDRPIKRRRIASIGHGTWSGGGGIHSGGQWTLSSGILALSLDNADSSTLDKSLTVSITCPETASPLDASSTSDNSRPILHSVSTASTDNLLTLYRTPPGKASPPQCNEQLLQVTAEWLTNCVSHESTHVRNCGVTMDKCITNGVHGGQWWISRSEIIAEQNGLDNTTAEDDDTSATDGDDELEWFRHHLHKTQRPRRRTSHDFIPIIPSKSTENKKLALAVYTPPTELIRRAVQGESYSFRCAYDGDVDSSCSPRKPHYPPNLSDVMECQSPFSDMCEDV